MTKEMLEGIVEILLDEVREMLEKKNVTVTFGDSLKESLLKEGFDSQYGARPLKRAITRLVVNPLSTKMLSGEVEEGSEIRLDMKK
jgi:ATP-dependent Clp protease ATP-binding subunit ClpA